MLCQGIFMGGKQPSTHYRRSQNVGIMLNQRGTRWSNIIPTLCEYLMDGGGEHRDINRLWWLEHSIDS